MRELPSGTVTFLFTDVEGSTRLLHELGAESYAEALAVHRRGIRDACAANGGVEVDTQGDAFFFAFPTASGAARAAARLTDALSSGPIQVRVGLHTGTPLVTDEGYVGDDVHLAARVAGSSHGGQVVLSEATRSAVGDDLAVSDLGEHRLKDVERPVAIFQLGGSSFPPLKTISNTNLPHPASSFVGRERELREVLARIEGGARLVTLTGPGGSGKTRLAIEAAASLVPEYKAGVFWIGLAAVRDGALVVDSVAQTLGAKDGLAEHIGEREMLLLLDNVEQVIDVAPELSALVQACQNLTLVVTSRELLRVQGEVEYEVPPLAEPDAVSLFCERAQIPQSDEIAELCVRLDSLPLAVELAAARTKALSPGQILERLSQRLDLLRGGRDADPRQQTLRATIEWSYDLLSSEEQRLFGALSVFVGGCTLEAAVGVADANLDTLQSLVEKSLVRFTNERYWMLETIREFAVERFTAAGLLDESKGRHLEYVLQRVSQLAAAVGFQSEESGFASELDNFRAALAWAAETGQTDAQLDLVSRSWPFWWYRGHPAEGLGWVESALAASRGERSQRTVSVLDAGAMFAYRGGEVGKLKAYAERSIALARSLDDRDAVIWPLNFLGIHASEVGDYSEATSRYTQAIDAARETGERWLVGLITNNLGVVAELQGDLARAVSLFESALEISRELGTVDDSALETLNLARCLNAIGRSEDAASAATDGLTMAREAENHTILVECFVLLARLALGRGKADVGARLIGAQERLRHRVGASDEDGAEAEFLDATVHELTDALGAGAWAKALAEGRAMSLDEAVEYALTPLD